jgi:hypothetical protein
MRLQFIAILFQNVGYAHAEWAFLDREDRWSSQGQIEWPWGADYDKPQPIRVSWDSTGKREHDQFCPYQCTTCLYAADLNPYDRQVDAQVSNLKASDASVRAGAAESLGYLRAYCADAALVASLKDADVLVRREAAMSLAWCGGRAAVRALIDAMHDEDWVVRQGAWVSLTNLTGMEFAFDAVADEREREHRIADEVILAIGCAVTGSSTYRGPAHVLTDGDLGGLYWQTKNVAFPQYCQVDLGQVRDVGSVIVHQYSKSFCHDRV